jgi:intracellular multiplication protein IcmO
VNLYLPNQGRVRHEAVVGKTGSGKTKYMLHRLAQQARAGGGAFIVDSKEEYDFRDELYSICRTYGRGDSFRCVNINNAAESNTYNPLLRGDAVSVASRFTDTVDVDNNPTAEHFRSQSNLALTAALMPIKALKHAYNPRDLYILLTNPTAMEFLLRQAPEGDARQSFDIWLESFRQFDNTTKRIKINTTQMRNQIGGVISRLFIYSVGELGKVLNSYNPEVDLLSAIDQRQIVYLQLPVLDKSEAAIAFAKLFLSDLRSTLAQMFRRGKRHLPRIPHEVWMDEFGSYANPLVAPIFEMARAANVALIPMFQTYANLKRVSEDFADQLMGNVEVQTFLQLGDVNTAEWAATVTGERLRKFTMESSGRTTGSGNKNLSFQFFHNYNRGRTESVTQRQEYDYVVRPEEFTGLDIGEAFVFVKRASQGWRIKLPMAEPHNIVPFKPLRCERAPRAGMNFADKFDAHFSSADYNAHAA